MSATCTRPAAAWRRATPTRSLWYRRAADQGLAIAQYNLGILYDNGHGVARDYREAAKWYRLAAAQGDADAQYSLGILYDDGHGVPRDDTEAAKWFHLAADQGYAMAQNNLGSLYARGDGVPKDYVQAYMWFALSAERDNALAVDNLKAAADELTPERDRPRQGSGGAMEAEGRPIKRAICGSLASRKSMTPNP